MHPKAKVISIDAIESFRTQLCLFNDKARQVLSETECEVQKIHSWLTNSQHVYWKNQIKLRSIKLEEAKSALHTARLSWLKVSSAMEGKKVRQAEEQLQEAQEKLRMTSKWEKLFENEAQPHISKLSRFANFLEHDMPKAIAQINGMIKSLQAYAKTKYAVEANEGKNDDNEHTGG